MSQIKMIKCPDAPSPLGNYSHAIAFRDLIFVSGIAARDPKTNKVPGLVVGPDGQKQSYDIRAETKSTIENIQAILHSAGSDLSHVLEVNVYLTNMKDFGAYNEVYGSFFSEHRPARTTIGVQSLPGQISIEMKVVAARK